MFHFKVIPAALAAAMVFGATGAAYAESGGHENGKEIAAVLGVTESRVCQLHSQSIARLRVKLREW